ncbi:hypothetical protein J5N97_001443 [Dioscorea zingiberensis]|uniref:Uncharacterized protein n=1 Tax=Dioscorea zingiberensis TaxID=325984 RepID=A0A9D5BTS8_9LILI|nr:hypothetical protein J5N97_001443 [Dioscorea zingiberensis]
MRAREYLCGAASGALAAKAVDVCSARAASTRACGRLQGFVGDVVMLKDPENPDDYLVRRFAAIEGYEMASRDEKDEPFVLEKDQCSSHLYS